MTINSSMLEVKKKITTIHNKTKSQEHRLTKNSKLQKNIYT